MRRVGKYPGWKDTRTLGKHTGGERLLARALTELLHPVARNTGFDESLVSAKGRAGQGDFGSKAETLLYQNLISRHHRSGQRGRYGAPECHVDGGFDADHGDRDERKTPSEVAERRPPYMDEG